MDVKNFLKLLLCDGHNNITINTLTAAIVASVLVVIYICGLVYLPYLIIYNPEISLFNICGMLIGIAAWFIFIPFVGHKINKFYEKYGHNILYTWK